MVMIKMKVKTECSALNFLSHKVGKTLLSFILRMKANVNQETYRDFIRKIFLEMSHMRQWSLRLTLI
ncbi:uncharacterized protein OCT59_002818 [Rhizophagus irregularis]|uniref:uncharacterized protein n=1 Tax=Rhizophagus irregularis TaxID=588596 RepID=UPI0033231245|nr:hypothetical protein OCT59_002818 [Rhizophagus irregularis]